MTKKIFIVDDQEAIVEKWLEKLGSVEKVRDDYEIVPVKSDEFKKALNRLEKRRKLARSLEGGDRILYDQTEACLFDDAHILIVDYDLLDFDIIKEGEVPDDHLAGVATGERVVYLARCYSRCGLLVVLNQFGYNRFDLKLEAHSEFYADINLGSKQLDNPNLWNGGLPTGFRPWSWFSLLEAAKSFESRYEELLVGCVDQGTSSSLDSPILKYLGFPDNFTDYFPRSVTEFLGDSKSLNELTFDDFVKDYKNGLKRKDKPLNDEAVARIAAARIFKWLERVVLPGQEILVDAPHLVSRFPSLLKGEAGDINIWNRTALQDDPENLPVDHEFLNEYAFRGNWTSRPAWFWHMLRNNEAIAEIKDPFAAYGNSNALEVVFCEDISSFLPKNATREFVADLPSPFVRRFVVDPDTQEGCRYAEDVKDVEYGPQVRLAL